MVDVEVEVEALLFRLLRPFAWWVLLSSFVVVSVLLVGRRSEEACVAAAMMAIEIRVRGLIITDWDCRLWSIVVVIRLSFFVGM